MLMKSSFVINADNTVQYVGYLGEMTERPNCESAVDAVKTPV